MPCTYHLHPEIETLHCRFAGHLNMRDILALIDRAAADPAHLDGMNVLADFLHITRFDIDWSAQRQMFARLAALSAWEGLPRSCAILVTGEPLWSLAGELVAQTTLKSPIVFDRFTAPAPALAFLGLDPRQYSERFGYLPAG